MCSGTISRSLFIAGLATVRSLAATPQSHPAQIDLSTAIRLSVENNFAIREARERIRQREGISVSVRSASLPAVTATGIVQNSEISSIQTTPVPSLIPEGGFWRLSLVASQAVFTGGGVRASIREAQFEREAAVLDFQQTVNAVLFQTRTRFYDVLLARELIKVQQENLRLLESELSDTTLKAKVGSISEFERLRAEVAVANAKPPLISARNEYRLAIEELRRALGISRDRSAAGQEFEIVGNLAIEPRNFDLQQSLDTAKANRPDLQRLAKVVAAREQVVVAARSQYYPQVSASLGADVRKGSTDKLSDSVEGTRGALQAKTNVFQRATSGQVMQAESQLEQARLAAAEANLAAELEIRRALSEIEQASELASATKQTVAQAEEAARLANARYQAGAAVQLDLLKAQVELTSTRLTAARASRGFNSALARLRAAMGFADVDYDLSGANLRSESETAGNERIVR